MLNALIAAPTLRCLKFKMGTSLYRALTCEALRSLKSSSDSFLLCHPWTFNFTTSMHSSTRRVIDRRNISSAVNCSARSALVHKYSLDLRKYDQMHQNGWRLREEQQVIQILAINTFLCSHGKETCFLESARSIVDRCLLSVRIHSDYMLHAWRMHPNTQHLYANWESWKLLNAAKDSSPRRHRQHMWLVHDVNIWNMCTRRVHSTCLPFLQVVVINTSQATFFEGCHCMSDYKCTVWQPVNVQSN